MGQILHVNARTTEAIRREIRDSKESIEKAAKRFNVNPKTIDLLHNLFRGVILLSKLLCAPHIL
ncbi:IS481 family transposase domain protein [Rickettsiales endosymbiont of Paramecium tredecaurelia]|nr:IS481 family transposase domain protein [Candidatus Sarmatiella mevalonica]